MRSGIFITAICVLWSGLILSACDNTISPLVDDAENIFVLHGFLDAAADTHYVHISALRSTVLEDNPALEGVLVRSFEAGTEEMIDWSITSEQQEDETGGRIFAGVFSPGAGRTYVIQILKNGEVAASATTTVPSDPSFFPLVPSGDTLRYSQDVIITGIQEKPVGLTMKYEVFVPESGTAETVLRKYSQTGQSSGSGWQFSVFLKQDQLSIARQFGSEENGPKLGLRKLGALLTVESDEFAEQEKPSNLESAHGFFGSLGRHEFYWTLDSTSVSLIGFDDQQVHN